MARKPTPKCSACLKPLSKKRRVHCTCAEVVAMVEGLKKFIEELKKKP